MATLSRTAQKLINDSWTDIAFEHLRPGDIYRMFESTGEPVVDNDENKSTTVFKVIGEVFKLPNGVWGIQDEPVYDP